MREAVRRQAERLAVLPSVKSRPLPATETAETRRAFWRHSLPLGLLGGLLLAALVTIFLRTGQYAISADEPIRDAVGRSIFNWYATLGRDTSFLRFDPAAHEPEHGGIFDAIVSAAQLMFAGADHWYVRHIVTALCGWVGLIAIALCGYELGGSWVAFVAALGLWLYPRYYGAIYNNPKDVPAAVSLTFVMWATLLLVKRWNTGEHRIRNSVLVGCALGAATAIRGSSVVWFAVLAALLAAWWAYHGSRLWREGRQAVALELRPAFASGSVIGATFLATSMALWPYVFMNPINLLRSLRVLSKYPHETPVLFNGISYSSTQLPRGYVVEWLVVGSPLILIVLSILGCGLIMAPAIRSRSIDGRFATLLLGFFIPLGVLLVEHPVLYNGLRHFLFLIPFIILLAAYGLVDAVGTLARSQARSLLGDKGPLAMRVAAVGLVAVTLLSYGLVIGDMVRLSPYEYMYFSPLVGGVKGANGRFDMDYWATCERPSAEWLGQHYGQFTSAPAPTVGTPNSPLLTLTYLPSAFRWDRVQPDFYIDLVTNNREQLFPTYTIIHTVSVQDVPLCVIKVNPASARLNVQRDRSDEPKVVVLASRAPFEASSTTSERALAVLRGRWPQLR